MKQFLGRQAQTEAYDNVEYILRHCDTCAKIGDKCPEYGTPHGYVKNLFNENRLGQVLLKKGILSGSSLVFKTPLKFVFGKNDTKKSVRNLVTSAGKAGIASRINGSGAAAAFAFIGIGTGAVAAAIGDTALGTEVTSAGAGSTTHAGSAPTLSLVTTTVTNDTAQLLSTITFSATVAVTESGVFNAATAGTLLCRQVFTAVNVVSGDSLQITWKVQAS